MSISKTIKSLVLLFCIGIVTGCAYTAQTVVIAPEVTVPEGNIGEGRTVSVYVVDERTSDEIGRRGTGMMRGAAITTEQDIAVVFNDTITTNLNGMGFSAAAVDTGTARPGSKLLRIDIRSLEYDTSVGFWTGGVHTKGSMKATATTAGGTYDQVYRVDEEKRVMVVPGANQNEQMINATASAILQEMFNDAALFRFLAE